MLERTATGDGLIVLHTDNEIQMKGQSGINHEILWNVIRMGIMKRIM